MPQIARLILLNLESNVIIESRDVEFFEHLLASENRVQNLPYKTTLRETSHRIEEQSSFQDINKESSEIKRSTKIRKLKTLGMDEIIVRIQK